MIGNLQTYDKTSIYYEITIVLKEKNQVFHLTISAVWYSGAKPRCQPSDADTILIILASQY